MSDATGSPIPGSPAPAAESVVAAEPNREAGASITTPIGTETKPRGRAGVVVAALAVGAIIGGASGAGVALLASSAAAPTPVSSTSAPTSITVNDTANITQVTAVAAKASPSVVTISVSSETAGGTGSGVVLTADGFVLTNAHVVTLDGEASDPTVRVETYDGRLRSATIIGVDPIADLAVIKVDGIDNLQPAEFADSAKLNVGDTAIAIGAPLGLAGTVTSGVVSALNRSITIASSAIPDATQPNDTPAPDPQNPYDFWHFSTPGDPGQGQGQQGPAAMSDTVTLSVIQTDAAINPGNSGGALLDSEGKVIGINVAIASAGNGDAQSGSIGVGFAIPSNLAMRVAEELRENGTASHGLLGASVLDVTEDTGGADSLVVGATIKELVPGGAAEKAGLRVGDVITGFNGVPITGKTDLTAQVRVLAAGSKATVDYVRDGKPASVEVTLGELQ